LPASHRAVALAMRGRAMLGRDFSRLLAAIHLCKTTMRTGSIRRYMAVSATVSEPTGGN
jgi:hypothetical protein